jgi:gluconokinase
VTFVLLEGSKELIAQRLAGRKHEFMDPKLLDSQFATLETPSDALCIVNDRTPDEVVSQILSQISPAQN